ncbi:MAG: hypothetical protein KDJ80_12470, partial [Nitratireductor sp.]|nr:hypothetical protein [Nitratireductor sp.]
LKCPLKRHIRGRRRLHPGVVVERQAGELNEIGFTHDPALAARCDRIIRVSSGRILGEETGKAA